MIAKPTYTVLITTYLEPEHVERIRQVSPRLDVRYEPGLLPPPRYPADHYNQIARTQEQEDRWRELLRQADILFDFDATHRDDLPELAPNVRWIQATSAGIGQFVRRMGYDRRMPTTVCASTTQIVFGHFTPSIGGTFGGGGGTGVPRSVSSTQAPRSSAARSPSTTRTCPTSCWPGPTVRRCTRSRSRSTTCS